jgi:hypothetical protein
MKAIVYFCFITLLVSCASSTLGKKDKLEGYSNHIRQSDSQTIKGYMDGKTLDLRIIWDSATCKGRFQLKDSITTFLGIDDSVATYIGTFDKSKKLACKEALGNKGGIPVHVEIITSGSFLGSKIGANRELRICEDSRGECKVKNSFDIIFKD